MTFSGGNGRRGTSTLQSISKQLTFKAVHPTGCGLFLFDVWNSHIREIDMKSVESMTKEEMRGLIHTANRITEHRRYQKWGKELGGSDGPRKDTLAWEKVFKEKVLTIVANAEEEAAKEVDPKKAERILINGAVSFYKQFGSQHLDYVCHYPFLAKIMVSEPLEKEYYGDDDKLGYWESGLAYYRLTDFGRWFMNNPEVTLEDCKELCYQYQRGEAVCFEKFFLREAERALIEAQKELNRWQKAVLEDEQFDPDEFLALCEKQLLDELR